MNSPCSCNTDVLPADALDLTSVTVKLNESAVLPCKWNCSGLSKWTMIDTQGIVAWCNETCWSDAGFLISHDQYLKGDLSLTVTAANYIKRGWYNCQCNETEICSVRLSIDTIRTAVQLRFGEYLLMNLSIPENVEVMYNQSVIYDTTSKQICTLKKGSLECDDKYTQRIERVLRLQVNSNDSGLYTIRDMENNEVIHVYNVSVAGRVVFLSSGFLHLTPPLQWYWSCHVCSTMQSCTDHCVLLIFIVMFTPVPSLAFITITVKLHQSAKLPCNYTCPGLGKWTISHNRDNLLAQCDQTSCSSVDGYKISHDEYVKGDLSLTITAADYTHRGLYTCNCNSMDVRDVRLSIETLMSSVELNSGEDLLMDLPVPQSLEVIYKPKDSSGLYGEQICTVTKHILQCKAEYTPRASLSYPELTLRDVNITDCGIYTIRDVEYEENIYIYTLYVIEIQRITDGQPVNQLLAWLLPALALMMGVIIGLVCILKIRSKLLKRVKLQQEEQERLEQERLLQQEEQERILKEKLLQERMVNQQMEEEHAIQQQQQQAYIQHLWMCLEERVGSRHASAAESRDSLYGWRAQMGDWDSSTEQDYAGAVMLNRSYSSAKYSPYLQVSDCYTEEYFQWPTDDGVTASPNQSEAMDPFSYSSWF
ncbi:hypothetical protein C0J50_8784 [Silurus asotus]|uniref:Immunoglobulin domain-containing protein n=1 Tax=Silurus asotus TaxID=30991 RepID=A0AAD5AFP0_SILAS|nr:hypothetical protein C0J50_8784 [Silurus asotus]